MNNKKPTIDLYTKKQKLSANLDQTIGVLVRITPPEAEVTTEVRPKLNLGMALDRLTPARLPGHFPDLEPRLRNAPHQFLIR